MDKQCFKCRETKHLSEFYAHPKMGDGHLGKCKTCTKRDVSERIELLWSDPVWVAKERARCRKKQECYRQQGKAKTYPVAISRWAKLNRHKRRAHLAACRAVKKGKIKIMTSCESCGATGKLHKHHADYSKPLEVRWLCPKCHGRVHWKS